MVDQGRDPRIGRAGDASAGLDGPETGVGMMLPVSRGIPPPSVVGDHENKCRALLDIIRNEVTEDGFVANHRGYTRAVVPGIQVCPEFLGAVAAECPPEPYG